MKSLGHPRELSNKPKQLMHQSSASGGHNVNVNDRDRGTHDTPLTNNLSPHMPDKQVLCKYAKRGSCKFGIGCRNFHDVLQSTPSTGGYKSSYLQESQSFLKYQPQPQSQPESQPQHQPQPLVRNPSFFDSNANLLTCASCNTVHGRSSFTKLHQSVLEDNNRHCIQALVHHLNTQTNSNNSPHRCTTCLVTQPLNNFSSNQNTAAPSSVRCRDCELLFPPFPRSLEENEQRKLIIQRRRATEAMIEEQNIFQ